MNTDTSTKGPATINKNQKSLPKRYSFEANWFLVWIKAKRWNKDDDKALFLHRLELNNYNPSKQPELETALNAYLRKVLNNIFYYHRKIIVENIMRKAYGLFTLLIVTFVPLFIFLYTDKAVGGVLPNNPLTTENMSNETDRLYKESVWYAEGVTQGASKSPKSTNKDNGANLLNDKDSSNIISNETGSAATTESSEQRVNQAKPGSNGREAPSVKSELDGLEAVGIIITVLLSSLFAVHQVLSQWAGKRKFRAHFHAAKVDLMNLHFDMEELAQTTWSLDDGYDYDGLIEKLKKVTKQARGILDEETKKYFELSASPAVELGSIFSSSITTANSLVSTFASKRYTSRTEELRTEAREQKATMQKEQEKKSANTTKLKVAYRKLNRMQKKDLALDDEIYELESIETPTQEEKSRKTALENRLYDLRESYDELLESIELMEAELEMLPSNQ